MTKSFEEIREPNLWFSFALWYRSVDGIVKRKSPIPSNNLIACRNIYPHFNSVAGVFLNVKTLNTCNNNVSLSYEQFEFAMVWFLRFWAARTISLKKGIRPIYYNN